MENAVEALKMAFAIMMFVMALSLSVSSLSKANTAVTSIINLSDRETEYIYVEPTGNTRIVGVETVVPTMYRAYLENFEIYFYRDDVGTPFVIDTIEDSAGNDIEINYINGSEVFGNAQEAVNHLNDLLNDGLYDNLSTCKFEEKLGEYYQNDGEDTPEANKITKRVITYILH